MKKIIFMALFALVSTFASAQELGVHGLFRTDSGNFGVGVQGRYNFTKEMRGAASFNYYFKSDNVSAWDINANAQYLFPLKKGFTLYPFAGLTYLHTSVDLGPLGKVSNGNLGLNLGGGLDYKLSNNMKLNVEPRFQLVKGYNELVLNVGVVYNL